MLYSTNSTYASQRNIMSDSPLDLDLKFLPDWLKEPANKNPYADFAGESEDRSSRRDFGRGPGGPRSSSRPGGSGRPGGGQGRPGGGPRDSRDGRDSRGQGGPRGPQNRTSQGPQSRGPQQSTGSKPLETITIPQRPPGAPPRPPLRQSGQQGQGTGTNRDNRDNRQGQPFPRRDPRDNQGGRDPRDRQHEQGAAGPVAPQEITIPLHVEIVPEANGIAALAKQIRASHRAYPLYGLGRMFLNKPERHRVRITSNAPAHPLHQVGEDGPVTLNRQAAEREAFRTLKATYYTEETLQLDAPKGNYSNVARCRLSGVLLGPTNHHGYQPALRRLFDSRFSRRMDFNEFLRQIEVVSDPAVIEEWKKQISSVTVFRTVQEAEPVEFKSMQEVEAHFRDTYLPKVVRSGRTLEMSGVASRDVNDRDIRDAIRTAWEKERGFPAQTVNHIRPRFMEAGLHIWKYRKRILFVSTVRPVRFGEDTKNVSAHIADILNIIETVPKCTRAEISNRLLKPHEAEEDFAKVKAAMAVDLHWLIQSGHVIEFHDGTLDLPLLPKDLAKEETAGHEEGEAASHTETSFAKASGTTAQPQARSLGEEQSAPVPEPPGAELPCESVAAAVQAGAAHSEHAVVEVTHEAPVEPAVAATDVDATHPEAPAPFVEVTLETPVEAPALAIDGDATHSEPAVAEGASEAPVETVVAELAPVEVAPVCTAPTAALPAEAGTATPFPGA